LAPQGHTHGHAYSSPIGMPTSMSLERPTGMPRGMPMCMPEGMRSPLGMPKSAEMFAEPSLGWLSPLPARIAHTHTHLLQSISRLRRSSFILLLLNSDSHVFTCKCLPAFQKLSWTLFWP
jgi:hypothetical protein